MVSLFSFHWAVGGMCGGGGGVVVVVVVVVVSGSIAARAARGRATSKNKKG